MTFDYFKGSLIQDYVKIAIRTEKTNVVGLKVGSILTLPRAISNAGRILMLAVTVEKIEPKLEEGGICKIICAPRAYWEFSRVTLDTVTMAALDLTKDLNNEEKSTVICWLRGEERAYFLKEEAKHNHQTRRPFTSWSPRQKEKSGYK